MQKSGKQLQLEYQPQVQDPFLEGDQFLLYKNQHEYLIKIQEKPDVVQTLKDTQFLTVKIGLQQQHGAPKLVKIELTSDTELYFNFLFSCTDWEFKRIKENQNLFIDFRDYPETIVKNFQKLSYDPKYIGVFTIFSQNEGKMQIIRKNEFKDDVALEFEFNKSQEEQINRSIQYRYNLTKRSYDHYQQKYEQACEVITAKNPSLMMQINKQLKKKR